MTIIMVKDKKIGGYTAYLKELPNVITEGETIYKAKQNLADTFHDVILSLDVAKF